MKTFFHSTLLVPAPEFAGNVSFRWMDTFKTVDNTNEVNVLVFNTTNKEEIKPLLEQDLKELQREEHPSEQAVHNMAYIQNLLNELETPGFIHDVPDGILKVLAMAANRSFAPQEVIYLSGISAVYND